MEKVTKKNNDSRKLAASLVRHINGKMVGKDGKPLRPAIRIPTASNPKFGTLLNTNTKPNGAKTHEENPNVGKTQEENHKSMLESVHDSSFWTSASVIDKEKPLDVNDEKTESLCMGSKSYVSVVAASKPSPKLNFRTLFNEDKVEHLDFVLPVENVLADQNKFANSLVGFFVGKRVAFPLVLNCVTNTWSKFGFQKVIKDDDDVFYFKFSSTTGLEQVLEQGPWLIRNQPLILTKWAPNLDLAKDVVKKVPVWVKIHKVPVMAYSEDGLSLIALQIRKPVMLDAFTSSMCSEPWGRMGYARALIEISVESELKKEVKIDVPIVEGEGHTIEQMGVEYEWRSPRCPECLVFGHDHESCLKRVVDPKISPTAGQEDGFTMVQNRKKKGKKGDQMQRNNGEGVNLKSSKPKFAWSIKKQNHANGGINTVKLKNHFNALQTQEDVTGTNNMGESSKSMDESFIKKSNTQDDDDNESEVEEVYVESRPTKKGASTPSSNGLDV
ncbi:hypothetical protein Tco_1432106 [Tanacetum coccineum]